MGYKYRYDGRQSMRWEKIIDIGIQTINTIRWDTMGFPQLIECFIVCGE